MPLKEDEIFLSHYKDSPSLQEACQQLDAKLPGIICSKSGNILYLNERAKNFSVKENISNILDLFSSDERERIKVDLLEGNRASYELSDICEYLIVFPWGKDLRCIIRLNLGARNYEDLLSLLRSSIHFMELLSKIFSQNEKAAEKPRRIISDRISKLMQLIELTELPAKPYSDVPCDVCALAKMLCNYASLSLSEAGGSIVFDSQPAIISRINPELYALMFCASISLVMCKSECCNMRICVEYEDGGTSHCKTRFSCDAFSEGAGLFLSFLEYACYKIGLDCSVISDKEMNLTEFTLVIETETDIGKYVKSDLSDRDLYNISRYAHMLLGRIYTAI